MYVDICVCRFGYVCRYLCM